MKQASKHLLSWLFYSLAGAGWPPYRASCQLLTLPLALSSASSLVAPFAGIRSARANFLSRFQHQPARTPDAVGISMSTPSYPAPSVELTPPPAAAAAPPTPTPAPELSRLASPSLPSTAATPTTSTSAATSASTSASSGGGSSSGPHRAGGAGAKGLRRTPAAPAGGATWVCSVCTFENPTSSSKCEMCSSDRE